MALTYAEGLARSLGGILGNHALGGISDSGAEFVVLNETDGDDNDDAVAYLLLENAGYAAGNVFGLYDFIENPDGSVTVNTLLEVFEGSDSLMADQKIWFNLATGEASLDNTNWITFDSTFGFYLTSAAGNTFYSHASLNDDGIDHMLLFDTSNVNCGVLGSDVVVAIEDLSGLPGYELPGYGPIDYDYDDMVVGMHDVNIVPEPGTVLLLGAGLIGLIGLGRKFGK